MFGNVFAAALRNLARNRLYATISIGGLAVALATVLLAGLYIRDQLTFDSFIPGHERLYVVVTDQSRPNQEPFKVIRSSLQTAELLKREFPAVRETTRYAASTRGDSLPTSWDGLRSVRRGAVETDDPIAFVDPNFFSVLPIKAIAGDPTTAMDRPDSVVLTRSMARKYFGEDAPIGKVLEINRKLPVRVAAVLEDFPGNTNLTAEIFLSGRVPGSPLTPRPPRGPRPAGQRPNEPAYDVRTYVKLSSPAAAAEINRAYPDFIKLNFPLAPGAPVPKATLEPVGTVHMLVRPETDQPPVSATFLYVLGAVAGLVLLVAGVNFVNLMTARAARRSVEIGVRKATGALRRHLVLQFLGESVLYAGVAMFAALGLVELCLPALEGLLGREVGAGYWRDPTFVAMILALTLSLGVLAGLYPALVMSAFSPTTSLKGGPLRASGSVGVRQVLVGLQFAILIVLAFAVLVMVRQNGYLMNRVLQGDAGDVLMISAQCRPALLEELRTSPGVRQVACSTIGALGRRRALHNTTSFRGREVDVYTVLVDLGYFDLYGVRPVAGRLFSPAYGVDLAAIETPDTALNQSVVVNEALVRSLGFTRLQDALGVVIDAYSIPGGETVTQQVVGVVPDVDFDMIAEQVFPTRYLLSSGPHPALGDVISVRIDPSRTREALAGIDRVWAKLGDPGPIKHSFARDHLRTINAGLIRQGWLVSAAALVATIIACLGLFALAAFTAELRTKEIGVRKAMGAATHHVVRLLLWEFSKPVLLANLVAWPVAWLVMERWLQGFPYRISLSPWLFLAASAGAVVIALATASAQAIMVARANPVAALRDE